MTQKILLVDDEPNIIELAQLYLEREGYRIISASDGKAALAAVEQHKPDLIVLDLFCMELCFPHMIHHRQCCQGFAVIHHDFTLDDLTLIYDFIMI